MNFTIGLPEVSMVSSLCLYLQNNSVMGLVFLCLSLFLAFGRLAVDLHKVQEKKREKESQINNVKDSIMNAVSYMSSPNDAKH